MRQPVALPCLSVHQRGRKCANSFQCRVFRQRVHTMPLNTGPSRRHSSLATKDMCRLGVKEKQLVRACIVAFGARNRRKRTMQSSRPSLLPCTLPSGFVESAALFPEATQRAPALTRVPGIRLAWRTPNGTPVDASRDHRKALDTFDNASDANALLWRRTSARARRCLLAVGSVLEKQAQHGVPKFPNFGMRNASSSTFGFLPQPL